MTEGRCGGGWRIWTTAVFSFLGFGLGHTFRRDSDDDLDLLLTWPSSCEVKDVVKAVYFVVVWTFFQLIVCLLGERIDLTCGHVCDSPDNRGVLLVMLVISSIVLYSGAMEVWEQFRIEEWVILNEESIRHITVIMIGVIAIALLLIFITRGIFNFLYKRKLRFPEPEICCGSPTPSEAMQQWWPRPSSPFSPYRIPSTSPSSMSPRSAQILDFNFGSPISRSSNSSVSNGSITYADADTLPLLQNLSLDDVPNLSLSDVLRSRLSTPVADLRTQADNSPPNSIALVPQSRHSTPLIDLRKKEDHQVETRSEHSTPMTMRSPITSVVEHYHASIQQQGKESEGVQKPCCQPTTPGIPVSCSGTVPLKRLHVDLTLSFGVSPQSPMSSSSPSSTSSSSPLSNTSVDNVVQSTSFPSHSRSSSSQDTVRMENTTGIEKKTNSDDAGNSGFGLNAGQQQQYSDRATMEQSTGTGAKGNRRRKAAQQIPFSPNAITEDGVPVKRSKRIAKQKENESQENESQK